MDLTRPQIRALMSGAKYLHDQSRPAMAPEPSKRFPAKKRPKKGDHTMKNVSGDQLDSLLQMPGLKLSPKSVKKLQYLRSQQAQKSEE